MGQNFSWIEQVCDEFEQQWNRNSRSSVRRKCVKIGCERFCMPIKGKNKTTKKRKLSALHQEQLLLRKELGTMLNQGNGNLPRENDGAIEFWRIKDDLQKFLFCQHWSSWCLLHQSDCTLFGSTHLSCLFSSTFAFVTVRNPLSQKKKTSLARLLHVRWQKLQKRASWFHTVHTGARTMC